MQAKDLLQTRFGLNFKPSLAIVAITAIRHMETAQRPKSQRPLSFFGSDRSDRSHHMETNLNMYKMQNL